MDTELRAGSLSSPYKPRTKTSLSGSSGMHAPAARGLGGWDGKRSVFQGVSCRAEVTMGPAGFALLQDGAGLNTQLCPRLVQWHCRPAPRAEGLGCPAGPVHPSLQVISYI